jgi:signal transduction histidine kinase
MHQLPARRSFDPADYHLTLVLDVPQPTGPSGVLLALVRWQEVQRILDGARDVLAAAGYASAEVALVDSDGRVHGCTDRSHYGDELAPANLRDGVLGAAAGTVAFIDGSGSPRLCGFARCGADAGQRWSLYLHMPSSELFAASDAFGRVLAATLVVTLLVLTLWSLIASAAIVRPVRALVDATAALARGELETRVPVRGGRELAELGAAFNAMAGELASGRERLKAVERQAAWAEMARQVAHEIKNPLTPMRMAAQLLVRARKDGDPRADSIAERLASTVLQQTEALDRIASDFRQFAGAPSQQLEELALDELLAAVQASSAPLFDGGRLQLELQCGAAGVRVRVDSKELARVFLNLLQNAAQAAPAGVRVQLRSRRDGDLAVVEVVDDGPGVPDAVRPRLFEPYFTTKSSGTGLGLAICRRLLEAHGGSIRLQESAPGRTVFRIELPLAGATS